MEKGGFTTKQYPLLEHLLLDTRNPIAKVALDNALEWQTARIIQLRAIFDEINRDLAVLCFMLPAPPPRGTEFTSIRIRNSQLPRNLFKDFGSWFIYRRVKTTNLAGKLSWVPALLPEKLSKLLDRYLVLIRPVESIFAQVLDDSEGCAIYQEYLWVQSGKQMTSKDFSQILSNSTRNFMGCQLSLKTWRHIAIAIIREFNPPRLGQNKISDLLSNHSTHQAQKTYARETTQLPFLTTDMMLESRDACTFWHDTLGFGKQKPPIPFRLLMYQSLGTSSTSPPHPPLPPPPTQVPLPAPNFGPQLAHAMTTLTTHLQAQHQSLKAEIHQGIQTAVSTGIEGYMEQSGLLNVIPQLQKLTELLETKFNSSPALLYPNPGNFPRGVPPSLFQPSGVHPHSFLNDPSPSMPFSPIVSPNELHSSDPFLQASLPIKDSSLQSNIPESSLREHNPSNPFTLPPPHAPKHLRSPVQDSLHLSSPSPPPLHQPPQVFTPSPLHTSVSAAPNSPSQKRPSPSSHDEDQAIMPPSQRQRSTLAPNSGPLRVSTPSLRVSPPSPRVSLSPPRVSLPPLRIPTPPPRSSGSFQARKSIKPTTLAANPVIQSASQNQPSGSTGMFFFQFLY